LSATALLGLLTSIALLHLHLYNLELRYPIPVAIAYAVRELVYRRTGEPPSGFLALIPSIVRYHTKADEGVGRGPGGPPHKR
jgi:hypothetical protein